MKVQVIFAHGSYGEFGNGSRLPWKHCKEDMQFFKSVTVNGVCVMGRATWDSLPSKLEDRVNVVLSNEPVDADHVMTGDLKDVVETLKEMYPDKTISIIGGLSLIEKSIDFADVIYKSTLNTNKALDATHFVENKLIEKIKKNYVNATNVNLKVAHVDIESIDLDMFVRSK